MATVPTVLPLNVGFTAYQVLLPVKGKEFVVGIHNVEVGKSLGVAKLDCCSELRKLLPGFQRIPKMSLRARIPKLSQSIKSQQFGSTSVASTSGLDSETALNLNSPRVKWSRRQGISTTLLCGTSILLGQAVNPGAVLAEENAKKEEGGTFVDGVLELLDPDQVTKTGKKLPKKYVKSVREVVKNLRESFTQDSKDGAKFRRNADSAKEAIREYLQNWRGSKIVETEDSYKALERAFRELGKFYSSKGPQAALPEDIRNRVLEDLNKADDSI